MFELDNSTIVAIGALLVAVVSVVLAIRKGKPADEAITLALQGVQSNREAMERYERMHAESQATVRQGYAAFTAVIRALAPVTPWQGDDALADVLEDIQTPGAPETPPAPVQRQDGVFSQSVGSPSSATFTHGSETSTGNPPA